MRFDPHSGLATAMLRVHKIKPAAASATIPAPCQSKSGCARDGSPPRASSPAGGIWGERAIRQGACALFGRALPMLETPRNARLRETSCDAAYIATLGTAHRPH